MGRGVGAGGSGVRSNRGIIRSSCPATCPPCISSGGHIFSRSINLKGGSLGLCIHILWFTFENDGCVVSGNIR